MKYRLGIDLGATSLGWCVLELKDGQPADILDLGVRIFSDGRDDRTKEPLAVTRRNARQLRRRRDRYLRRRLQLLNYLRRHSFLPSDPVELKALELLDPYALRARALDQELTLPELGRALFHINQRRGFKSNRVFDKRNAETGEMYDGIRKLREGFQKSHSRTLGEYLFKVNSALPPSEQHRRMPVRFKHSDESAYNEIELYPERGMYEAEFDAVWESQQRFHKELTGDHKEVIKNIIFYQRPLNQEKIALQVGNCTFEQGEKRLAWAAPLAQSFRIWQEVNLLAFVDETGEKVELSSEQKVRVAKLLHEEIGLFNKAGEITFVKIKKILGLSSDCYFNLESDKRKSLMGDGTAYELAAEECFGSQWFTLNPDRQQTVIDQLLTQTNKSELMSWLCQEFGLSENQAANVSDVILPQGYCHLSRKALERVMPFLREGFIYTDACLKAGYHPSDFRPKQILDDLPYYGEALPRSVFRATMDPSDPPEIRYGKISNPTVHIGLNQLRKVVNALIGRYGHPQEIVIELARELKLPRRLLTELQRLQTKNQETNERVDGKLREMGITINTDNRLRYKLWEELSPNAQARYCPYSGKPISVNDVFSRHIQIEHILPFSRTFDDTTANKILCFESANNEKKDMSPFEAFGSNPKNYVWTDIYGRAQSLPENKKWRFNADAMEKYEKDSAFIARQLNDTKYMSRIAKEYLQHICDANKVWAIPGMLTGKLRHQWGLNLGQILDIPQEHVDKMRHDHRHHAVDAFVVACIRPRLLEDAARQSARDSDDRRPFRSFPPPMVNFDRSGRSKLRALLENVTIAHKPDHKGAAYLKGNNATASALHNETAYGYVKRLDDDRVRISYRKPIGRLLVKDIPNIADELIRSELLALTSGTDKPDIIARYADEHNIKRVRLWDDKNPNCLVGITDKNGRPYKWYATDGNYCAEIYCPAKGPKKDKWQVEVITNFHAHQKGYIPKWRKDHPTARLVMRLFQNDMVAWQESGNRLVKRVKKFDQNGRLFFEDHKVAKAEKSNPVSARQLQERCARKIYVDVLGKLKDPFKETSHNNRKRLETLGN